MNGRHAHRQVLRKTLGVPTVVCGPGDIAQAHQPNEFVARSQMNACDAFLGRMIGWAEQQ